MRPLLKLLPAATFAAASAAFAALPLVVDGQPLPSLAPMLEKVTPAVVNIATLSREASPMMRDPFFRRFFEGPGEPQRRERSAGSGVIVDAARGLVITNHHVVRDAQEIVVLLKDRRVYKAEFVGSDPGTDIAVLRIPAEKLTAIRIGDSDAVNVGDFAVAIGNPFGIGQTVTSGIISALGRTGIGEGYEEFIQTDASINPGNSGGPLLNINGELIGINTAIYGKAQGIGFAIPVDRVRRNLKELVSYGEVRRGWVGVAVQDLTDALARHFGVRQGVVVTDVDPKSPAAGADLRRGDVITKVDGQPVRSEEDFSERVDSRGIGETIALTLRRDDRDDEVRITAAEFPDDGADDVAWQRLGLAVEADRNGLVVRRVRPGSPCARIGLARGDRLLGIGGTALESTAQFRRRIASLRGARSVLLAVGRGDREYHVNVPLARD